jgi:hypothetical protein
MGEHVRIPLHAPPLGLLLLLTQSHPRTSARIEPRTLTPRHLTGKTFASKMVDYAFVLLPDETMHRAILDVLRRSLDDEDHNINQTRSGPVRFRPITVNIEVKVPGEGRNQTMVQLSVWVTAQFKKLNALTDCRGAVREICIPLVSAEGHDWRVYIAYQTADGEVVRLSLLCSCDSSLCCPSTSNLHFSTSTTGFLSCFILGLVTCLSC